MIAIIRILQVTRMIQRIFQPEVITHYSIGQIHDIVYKNEDIWGKKTKYPWGLYKFQATKFPEEFDNEADESRTDLTISYKDALASFDYEGYFLIPSNEVNWSEIDFDKPEIAALTYSNIIENKISAFATKLRDGACVFKIYLLESKRIRII